MFIAFLPFLPAILSGVKALFSGGGASRAAGAIGSVLGGAAGARGQAQQQGELAQLRRDQLGLDRYALEEATPGRRLGTSVRASMAANAQPFKFGQITPGMGLQGQRPGSTGGARPDMLSPDTRQTANEIMHQILMRQLSGTGPPPIAGPPKSGKVDKTLGIGGVAGGLIGAIGSLFGRGRGGGTVGGGMPTTPMFGIGERIDPWRMY